MKKNTKTLKEITPIWVKDFKKGWKKLENIDEAKLVYTIAFIHNVMRKNNLLKEKIKELKNEIEFRNIEIEYPIQRRSYFK